MKRSVPATGKRFVKARPSSRKDDLRVLAQWGAAGEQWGERICMCSLNPQRGVS